MREVILRIRHNGEPECEVSAEYPQVLIQSVSSMTGGAGERKLILELRGDTDQIAGFIERFGAAESVASATPLTPVSASRVYVDVTVDAAEWDSISDRLTEMGVHYRSAPPISGGWERWTIYIQADDDLPGIIGALEAAGNDVTLVRNVELSEVEPPRTLEVTKFLDSLTHRQREVLEIAIEHGYYRQRKETSIEELADELGLATTTTWEHLSRAEEKVMNGIADDL
ncbi:helix-turn-helix domain-containing protein [Haloferacaceae archaeon DSL9]